ncbi:hypothetical protein PSU4_13670 [Pseudonocardia sulfidoxydans NBRC 16205]|uniref:Carbon monoxide dehydrogenase subunit G n=1 Tax=Pseudonocardia sulfidoxydans NBRC 16205 TaxID=1223511 RepID=A0A511DDG6_9PSEU|nr:hypothetical protein [Pseudonocardia sulfidoxydans]GEL22413.1 hypothetical protein PSU4_13670 [Pseudonocardia sulfidoxydans NBRC 16205]
MKSSVAVLTAPVEHAIAALEDHRFIRRCLQDALRNQSSSGDVIRGVMPHPNGQFFATLRIIDADTVAHRVCYEVIVREARGSTLGTLRIAATVTAQERATALTVVPTLSVNGFHTEALRAAATHAVEVFTERVAAALTNVSAQEIVGVGAAGPDEAGVASPVLDSMGSSSRRARLLTVMAGIALSVVLLSLRQRRSRSSGLRAIREAP